MYLEPPTHDIGATVPQPQTQSTRLPLVSVVTPSYNQGQFIEETLLSVKQQRYPRIEHIVIDGGSRDSTLDTLRRYEGTYDLRWLSEPDGGMYEAINKGLRLCRGDILAYLNSDDRYLPWTVEVVTRAFSEHPQVDFIFGDMLNVKHDTGTVSLYLFPPFKVGHIRRIGFLGQPTVFWRRAVLERWGPFDASLKFVADCDYWMRIGDICQSYKINEVLAIERDHAAAKRLASTQALFRELAQVRARYIRQQGGSYQMRVLEDRFWACCWQRYLLVRFLLVKLRAQCFPGSPGRGPWRHITTYKDLNVPWARALLGFLPFRSRLSRLVRQWRQRRHP